MGEAEPARDVGLLRDDFRVQEAVNAAAVRVSHDDDVAHVEVLHGVFDGGDDRIMKLIAAVFVVIINYVFSKLFIFKSNSNKEDSRK